MLQFYGIPDEELPIVTVNDERVQTAYFV